METPQVRAQPTIPFPLDDSFQQPPGLRKLPPWSPLREPRDRPTDECCKPIFLIALVLALALVGINLPAAQYSTLDFFMDSEGRMCGRGEGVRAHPFLYVVNFNEPFRSLCVATCPKFDYNQIEFNADGTHPSKATTPTYFESLDVPEEAQNAFKTDDNISVFDFDPTVSQGKYGASDYKAYLDRYKLDCSPNADIPTCAHSPDKKMFLYDSRPGNGNICVPITPRVRRYATLFDNTALNPPANLWAGRFAILLSVFTALALCLLFTACVSCCMTFVMWVSVVVASCLCFALAWLSLFIALQASNPYITEVLDGMKSLGFIFAEIAGFIKTRVMLMFLLGILLGVTAVSLPVVTVFRSRHVRMSSHLLQSAHLSISRNRNNLFITAGSYFSMLLAIGFTLWGFATIYTTGDIVVDHLKGNPYPGRQLSNLKKFELWVFCLIAAWLILSVANLPDWLTTTTAVGDFFSTGQDAFRSSLDRVKLHIGSILFGGALFLPVGIVRVVLYPLHLLLSLSFMQFASKWLCLHDWYARYILRVSEHAYAVQALVGVDVVPSAKLFHHLEARHTDKYPYSSGLIISFCALGVLVVSFVNQWVAMKVFGLKKTPGMRNDSGSLVTILFLTALMAIVFMRVFYCSVYGILGAFYAQIDRDGYTTHEIMSKIAPDPRLELQTQPLLEKLSASKSHKHPDDQSKVKTSAL